MNKKINLHIEKWWFYIGFAIIVKLIFLFYGLYFKSADNFRQGIFYVISGDASDYVAPVENLLEHGEHRTDDGSYAIRMPGYTPLLLFLRLLFSYKWALNIILIIQTIGSALSCYFLALIAMRLFKSPKIFLITYFLYLISFYVSIWDKAILTESFATAYMIISFYLFIIGLEKSNKFYLFLSGFFISWCFFLRPYMLPVIALYGIVILYKYWNIGFKKIIVTGFFFILPFVVMEGSWIIRNYIVIGKPIMTQTRISYRSEVNRLKHQASLKMYTGIFCASVGGSQIYWQPQFMNGWFFTETDSPSEEAFPKCLFNDTLTYDRLLKVKEKCLDIQKGGLSNEQLVAKDKFIKQELDIYLSVYKANNPFHHHVVSRLLHLKRFLLNKGQGGLPLPKFSECNKLQGGIKLFYALLTLSVFFIGMLWSLILIFKRYKTNILIPMFFLIAWYLILLFPIVFRGHEHRMNTLAYPIFLVALSHLLLQIGNVFSNKLNRNKCQKQ